MWVVQANANTSNIQLAYLEKAPGQLIDSVYGTSELLLFDIDKLITKIDTDLSQLHWISKQTFQDELGRLSSDQFLDFALLLGSKFLPTFPPFEGSSFPIKRGIVRDALALYNSAGRSVLTLCSQFEEDRRVQDLQYLDRYKRAYMTVKHHVYMDIDGKVGPLDADHASSDLHELIGQRLPEELYFYLSKGLIGANVPSSLTSGVIVIPLPPGVEDSEVYRHLAIELLMPIRTQAICLLSNSLHRFYQTKVIAVHPWFGEASDSQSINLKALPSVKETIQSWRISDSQIPESLKKLPV